MGAGNYARVKELYRKILLCTAVIGLGSTALFELAPRTVVGMFGAPTNLPNPEDYWVFGEKTFRIFLCLVTFTCIIKMTSIFFQAVAAQDRIIRKIADQGSCVIVGRAADYVLRDYEDVVRIFVYAPEEYRMNRVTEIYGDSPEEAKKNIRRSDEARASYYKNISGLTWGDRRNYELMIDSSIGTEASAEIICAYLKNRN